MKTVGIRELKNSLSAYVREVRGGETIVVTDRGEVVARLVPPEPAIDPANPFAEMARRGEVILGRSLTEAQRKKLYGTRRKPMLKGITVAELLDEVRGDR